MDNEKFEKSFKIYSGVFCPIYLMFSTTAKRLTYALLKETNRSKKTPPLSYAKVLKIVDGSPALIFFFGKLLI